MGDWGTLGSVGDLDRLCPVTNEGWLGPVGVWDSLGPVAD